MWQEYIDSVIERSSKDIHHKTPQGVVRLGYGNRWFHTTAEKQSGQELREMHQRWLAQRAVKPAPVPSQWGITLPLILINTMLIVAGGPALAIAVTAIAALVLIVIRQLQQS
jgi:hypothetical protein